MSEQHEQQVEQEVAAEFILGTQADLATKREALTVAKLQHMATKHDVQRMQAHRIAEAIYNGELGGKNAEERKDNRAAFEATDKVMVDTSQALHEATNRLVAAESEYLTAKDRFNAWREVSRIRYQDWHADHLPSTATF